MWYYDGRIRIKPNWNVNNEQPKSNHVEACIRIKPNWNVKLEANYYLELMCTDQNKTRLECKVQNTWHYIAGNWIRIKPDWNVKTPLLLPAHAGYRIRIKPDWNVKTRKIRTYGRQFTLE